MKRGAKEKLGPKSGGQKQDVTHKSPVALKVQSNVPPMKVVSKVVLKVPPTKATSPKVQPSTSPSAVKNDIPEPKGLEEVNDRVINNEDEKTDWRAEGIDPRKEISKRYFTKNKTIDETNQLILKLGYQTENQVGRGGFGVVKRAIQAKSNKEVAIKIIDVKMKDDEKIDERRREKRRQKRMDDLRHELFVLEKVKHENIIQLIQHFMIDDILYIVMEYADGGTLGELVKQSKKPLTESKARRWFVQTCRAVHYMHRRGFSHRDLKLPNMLLKKPRDPITGKTILGHRTCKVTDFGLSRVSWTDSKGPFLCISFVGTCPYMSPEILQIDIANEKGEEPKPYNPMIADIWALGVCLYAMLCRAYPFNPDPKVNSRSSVVQLMKDGNFKFARKVRKTLSSEVKDLIRNMLTADVDSRITFAGILTHEWMRIIGRSKAGTVITNTDTTRTKTGTNCRDALPVEANVTQTKNTTPSPEMKTFSLNQTPSSKSPNLIPKNN